MRSITLTVLLEAERLLKRYPVARRHGRRITRPDMRYHLLADALSVVV